MSRVSERERVAVRTIFARQDAARNLWNKGAPERALYRDTLRNRFPPIMAGVEGAQGDAMGEPYREQVNFNLPARIQAFIKSKVCDTSPELRISGMREDDFRLATMNEHLLSRIMERGGAPRAVRAGVDDAATLGCGILWFGVDTYAIDHSRLEGLSTEPSELVAAAAQGALVHPLPGMDHLQVAETARNVYVQGTWTLTEANKENLLRLAAEAEAAFRIEQDGATKTFTPYRMWYRAGPYGDVTLSDSTVWDLQDSAWMSRKIVFSPERFRAWEPFKRSARRNTKPRELGPESGHETISLYSFEFDVAPQPVRDLNKCHVVYEFWDRETEKVHYVTEGYDGYLEEDDSYPYNGEDGRPVWDEFFPCEWVVPYQHNVCDPTRPTGVPGMAFYYPQVIETIKHRSAALAASKRAANIYETGGPLTDEQKAALIEAKDGTIIERTEGLPDGQRMIERLPTGDPPTAYFQAARSSESDAYAMAAVAPSEITGQPVADTAAQEEMVTRGAGAIQGDIVAQWEECYGKLARRSADIVRLFFTPQHAARYLGTKYVTPKVDEQGQVVEPAPFDSWKADSLDGVDVVASFATKGHQDNPIFIKQLQDLFGGVLNFRDATGLWIKDPKAVLDRISSHMNLGLLPEYQPTKAEMLVAALAKLMEQQGGAQQPGVAEGAEGGGGPKPNGQPHEPRKDGRKAGGQRGAPAIEGRQGRHRGPPSVGDMTNRVTRLGTS